MRKIVLLIAIVALSACAENEPVQEYHWSTIELLKEYYGEPEPALTDFDKLTLAIALTESRFQPDADSGEGDYGLLQLRGIYIAEVNRLTGENYTVDDAFDIDKSIAIFRALQDHYNPEKDLAKGIYYHNKSSAYKATVMQNYELICRMEIVRAKLMQR